MTWNHRLFVHFDGTTPYFRFHECLYNRPGELIPHSWTKEGVEPIEDTVDDMRVTLTRMRRACNKPILVIRRNKAYEWDGKRPRKAPGKRGES